MGYKDKRKQLDYQNKWMQNRRQQWVEENGPCAYCGSWERLEVDHINPEEKWSHRIWAYREEKRLKELEKCQVLCYDCHKQKTRDEEVAAGKRMSDVQIQQAQQMVAAGKSYRATAKFFGVNHKTIIYHCQDG
jgi:5-methylcytosine-specific restriction endonuclease McrA